MIWKLERDGGMTPKMLSLMRELRELRMAKCEPVAVVDIQRGRGDGGKYALCFTSAGHSLPDDVYNLYTVPPASAVDADAHADAGMITEGHQQHEREEHPMCRNCNDGIRNGCSSCAYKDK
ncbi:hypothetical protein [Kluyvera intermedia]|uniref:hypothetical protein n=1 Tax=Kluyvera intermedia TaxID=61648 RepID=UPI00372D74DE